MKREAKPVCLTIGGSDSCGGAGVQADLRVFESLDVSGCSATTALTAQNPRSITRIEAVSLAQLDAEIHAVFDYYDVAAVKTGMLVDAEHSALVASLLQQLHGGVVVVDPVMISSSGKTLLDAGGVDAITHALIPQATLVTPNLDEASLLLGEAVSDPVVAVKRLSEELRCAVLLKGGHGEGEHLLDLLCNSAGEVSEYSHSRQPWSIDQRHGTGCRLASAITANLSMGIPMATAVSESVKYLQSE